MTTITIGLGTAIRSGWPFAAAVMEQLSAPQVLVAQLRARGWTNKQIAGHMDIGLRTVEMHAGVLHKIEAETYRKLPDDVRAYFIPVTRLFFVTSSMSGVLTADEAVAELEAFESSAAEFLETIEPKRILAVNVLIASAMSQKAISSRLDTALRTVELYAKLFRDQLNRAAAKFGNDEQRFRCAVWLLLALSG